MTAIQPQLWVEPATEAIAFYEAAFGAHVLHRVGDGEDIVAQLAVGEAAFWIATASRWPDRRPVRPRVGDRPPARQPATGLTARLAARLRAAHRDRRS